MPTDVTGEGPSRDLAASAAAAASPSPSAAAPNREQLEEEMLLTYEQLKGICGQLHWREKQRRSGSNSLDADGDSSSSSSDEPTTIQLMKPGLLRRCIQEMRGLVDALLLEECACLSCGGDATQKMERNVKEKEDESKRKDEEILELNSKLSLTEMRLSAMTEERDTLRADLANTTPSKDKLIKKAWEIRDKAVKRKNDTRIVLAQTQIEVEQINSQLFEAIKQKLKLSQQLEDMEELLEEQERGSNTLALLGGQGGASDRRTQP